MPHHRVVFFSRCCNSPVLWTKSAQNTPRLSLTHNRRWLARTWPSSSDLFLTSLFSKSLPTPPLRRLAAAPMKPPFAVSHSARRARRRLNNRGDTHLSLGFRVPLRGATPLVLAVVSACGRRVVRGRASAVAKLWMERDQTGQCTLLSRRKTERDNARGHAQLRPWRLAALAQ